VHALRLEARAVGTDQWETTGDWPPIYDDAAAGEEAEDEQGDDEEAAAQDVSGAVSSFLV
jgi:hypothetical protein